MKLAKNPSVTQPTFTCFQSIMEILEQCVKSIQSSEAYLQTQLRIFAFYPVNYFAKNLHQIRSTGFSITTLLNLMTETPHKLCTCHYCAFIVEFERFTPIGFHEYFLYFTHKFRFAFFRTSKCHLKGFQKLK